MTSESDTSSRPIGDGLGAYWWATVPPGTIDGASETNLHVSVAAAELRRLADRAVAGEWINLTGSDHVAIAVEACTCHGGSGPHGHERECGLDPLFRVGGDPATAEYVARLDPDTGAAVADLLEAVAANWAQTGPELRSAAQTVAERMLQ